ADEAEDAPLVRQRRRRGAVPRSGYADEGGRQDDRQRRDRDQAPHEAAADSPSALGYAWAPVAADDGEQHAEEEPAEIGRGEGRDAEDDPGDPVERAVHGVDQQRGPRRDQQRADQHAEDPADPDVDDQFKPAVHEDAAEREEHQLNAGHDQQEAAPEGAAPPPGSPPSAPCHDDGPQVPPKPRLRSGSVNVPAVVSQVCWTRLSISIESACWPKPPAVPVVPGSSLSDPASRPMLMLWKVASLPVCPEASTIRLSASTGLPEPPAVRCRVTGPIVTLWHRLVSVAEWMAEMMTGWLPEAPEICPPYCSNPVPVSLLAVMRYSWPETEMLEAMAPSAVSPMSRPAMTAAGTATIANRRHLTRPGADELLLMLLS